jgi:ADP-ribose pyrophosphatase YjhB (NUDIX family)
VNDTVEVLDGRGEPIGQKPRRELDKRKDVFAVVYGVGTVGDKFLLARIAEKPGGIPKLNAGKWGLPVATIIRAGEDPEAAFARACREDLGLEPEASLRPPRMVAFQTSSARLVHEGAFSLPSVPTSSAQELRLFSREEVANLGRDGLLAETAALVLGV